ncbi:MAG: hypothetical protein V3V82_08200 [Acidimicrobiia bacterium]
MNKTTDHVLELVVFELANGVTQEEFLPAADAVSEWVKTQPGFKSRELSYSPETDKYVEVVYWDSLEQAIGANAASETSDACTPMFDMIALESATFLHAEPLRKVAA